MVENPPTVVKCPQCGQQLNAFPPNRGTLSCTCGNVCPVPHLFAEHAGLRCVACRKLMLIPPSLANQNVACPSCENVVTVPGMRRPIVEKNIGCWTIGCGVFFGVLLFFFLIWLGLITFKIVPIPYP